MKTRALFVDDEPLVLSGLRRMLRSLRHDWDVSFANSAEEALILLRADEFTVVVSDMRMPGMDGASLLNEVAERHPDVARLVLSGHAEFEAILRAVRPAHQFLAKPCDPKLLERALERIRAVRLDGRQGSICKKLGAYRRLPSPRATIERLRAALSASPIDLERVSDIVSGDIAMTVQVLRLVNAAFFGQPTRTFDARRAVSILGPEIMKSLLDEVELFRPVNGLDQTGEEAVIGVNRRAAALAAETEIDRHVAPDQPDPETLAMMALSGPLAAIEIAEPLDPEGEYALSVLLLAYWGLDIDLDLIRTPPAEFAAFAQAEAHRHLERLGV